MDISGTRANIRSRNLETESSSCRLKTYYKPIFTVNIVNKIEIFQKLKTEEILSVC
jgi:hypothetical protein